MEFSVKTIPHSQIEVDVSVSPEEMEKERLRALEAMRGEVQAEGFRPGHVPAEVAAQKIGEERLLIEAANGAAHAAFDEVVREQDLDPIGEPEVEVRKLAPGNPFEFCLRITVLPSLDLPDYGSIVSSVEPREVSVDDKEIDEALAWLQKSRAADGQEPPELNDAFASSLGAFETLDALKESIREGLLEEKKNREKERMRQEMLAKIADRAEGEIPDLLVEREKDRMLEQMKQGARAHLQMEFEEYLQKVQKTEHEVRDSFGEAAAKRIKEQLVLREIARTEGVRAEEEEIKEEADRFLRMFPSEEEAAKTIDPERLRAYSEDAVITEKTFRILESKQP